MTIGMFLLLVQSFGADHLKTGRTNHQLLPCCSHRARLAKVLTGAVKSIMTSNCLTACSRLSTRTIPCFYRYRTARQCLLLPNGDSGRSDPAPNSESGFWTCCFTRLRPHTSCGTRNRNSNHLAVSILHCLMAVQLVDLNCNYLPSG